MTSTSQRRHPYGSAVPIQVLSVVSMAGGIAGFTFARSFPSLFGGLGVGAAMAVAGLRIADGQDYGYALACVSSVGLAVPMVRRAVRTHGMVPIVMGLVATASAGYYANATATNRRLGRW